MAEVQSANKGQANRWRLAGWGLAGLLLLLPLVAMQFGDEVNWTASDFVFAATLIGLTGGGFELMIRQSASRAYRAGAAAALLGAFALVWINGAVGIIANESNDANLWFAVVIMVAVMGSIMARFRPSGLSKTMIATAAVQAAIAVVALITDMGAGEHPMWRQQLIGITAMFLTIWLASAALFHTAARDEAGAIRASE